MTANRYKRTRTLGANQHNVSILVLVLDLARARNGSYGERRIRVGFRASKGKLKAFMLIDTRISLDSNPTKYQQSIECSEHTKPRICGTSARAPPGRPRTLRSALRALPCPESPVPPAARAASS